MFKSYYYTTNQQGNNGLRKRGTLTCLYLFSDEIFGLNENTNLKDFIYFRYKDIEDAGLLGC